MSVTTVMVIPDIDIIYCLLTLWAFGDIPLSLAFLPRLGLYGFNLPNPLRTREKGSGKRSASPVASVEVYRYKIKCSKMCAIKSGYSTVDQ